MELHNQNVRGSIPLLAIFLLFVTTVYAADTDLCLDTDKDGVFSIIKDSGEPDRDCDKNASVSDGGTDCDDTRPDVWDGGYTVYGCNAGYYRYCEGGVYKSGPGGSSINANGGVGCVDTDINEKTNKYFVSGSGSGTACTSGSPCALSAVSNGGSVTVTSPAQIVLVGSTDITTSTGFLTTVSGSSSSNKNLLIRDPRSTAKITITGGSCNTSCATLKAQANNWKISGFHITGGDATGSGGIRADGDNIEIGGNRLYDIECNESYNCAGIYVGENLESPYVHNNIITDVGDPSKTLAGSTRQNVWLIGAFKGRNIRIEGNSATYSHAVNTTPYWKQGGGFRIKHNKDIANCTAGAHSFIDNNVIGYTEYGALRTNSGCMSGSGNYIINAAHFIEITSDPDLSGHDIEFSDNTAVMTTHTSLGFQNGGAITVKGTMPESTIGGIVLKRNVINDSAQTTYGGGNYVHLVSFDPYGSDADYATMLNVTPSFTANASTDLLTHSASIAAYARVRLLTSGSLPGGLGTGTDYYVIPDTATTIKLANSYANAVAGNAIDITSTGSGTHTINGQVPQIFDNCYYNSAISGLTNGFNFFGDNGSTSNGSIVNFANAKLTPYSFDLTSTEGNMALDNEGRVTAVCPVGTIGWENQWPDIAPAPTPTPSINLPMVFVR